MGRARSGSGVYIGHIFIIGGHFVFSCVVSKYARRHQSRVSELLSEGPQLFPSSSSTPWNPGVNYSRSAGMVLTTINETLKLAKRMLCGLA